MPLVKYWKVNTFTSIVVWKIEEPESFFIEKSSFQSDYKNEKRRLEHVCGRFLLRLLDPHFPISKIETKPNGKPYLPPALNRDFSISHSYPYVAAVISRFQKVGIDIQVYRDKIVRLKDKFLSLEEQELCQNEVDALTLSWCSKEAVFKWSGSSAIDFIHHMPIQKLTTQEPIIQEIQVSFEKTEEPQQLNLGGWLHEDYAMAWLVK